MRGTSCITWASTIAWGMPVVRALSASSKGRMRLNSSQGTRTKAGWPQGVQPFSIRLGHSSGTALVIRMIWLIDTALGSLAGARSPREGRKTAFVFLRCSVAPCFHMPLGLRTVTNHLIFYAASLPAPVAPLHIKSCLSPSVDPDIGTRGKVRKPAGSGEDALGERSPGCHQANVRSVRGPLSESVPCDVLASLNGASPSSGRGSSTGSDRRAPHVPVPLH